MTQELIGKTLNRYQITSLLDQGGMGAVYKGHDATLQRDVAIKVMHAHFAHQPNFRDRFLLEARTAARLDHPGIVKVFDFGGHESVLYIVMEYIAGENLYQKLDQAKKKGEWLPLFDAVQIVRQIAAALDYAHKQGILHRDIKPANILLKPGASEGLPFRPVVADLGLARLAVGQNLTLEGTSVGTPAYLSPEQANGETADVRSDVYSLGVLLFELTTGKPPFKIQTLPEAIRFHGKIQPPSPREKRPNIPENLEQVILKALQKDPAKRFPDAGSLAQVLEKIAAWLAQNPVSQPIPSPPPSPMPQARQGVPVQRLPLSGAPFPGAPAPFSGAPAPHGGVPAPSQRGGAPASAQRSGYAPPSLPPKGVDYLQIEAINKPPQSVPINKPELIMGRGKEVDIPLNSLGVSREHARLTFDGTHYHLTDMNSVNGTLMDNVPLLPGVREFWSTDKPVIIGAFTIQLVRAGKSAPAFKDDRIVSQIFLNDGNLADPRDVYTSAGDGRIEATLEADDLEVNPGESIGTTLHLVNQGSIVDHFVVTVEGLPPKWVTITPAGLNLMPGDQGAIQMLFKPPREITSKAGIYDLVVRVSSKDAPNQSLEIVATLTVLPYLEYHSELQPPKVKSGQRTRVIIRNKGNNPETFVLTLKSQADDLAFTPPGAQAEIAEGQPGAIEFSAKPRSLRLWRKPLTHIFTAEVHASSGGEKNSFGGEVVSNGWLPVWLPPLLLLLCLALAALSIPAYTYLTKATPTSTAVPVVGTPSATVSVLLPLETPGPVAGAGATPTVEILPPTPTPFCPGAPDIHVKKGDTVVVVTDDQDLKVHSQPIRIDGNKIYELKPGTELTVVKTKDSPVCYTIDEEQNQRVIFWLIKVTDITFDDGSKMGWVVEGTNEEYYIDPME